MSKVLWYFDIVKAPGETLDMEGMERHLLHFGFLMKPRFMVQFVPVQRNWEDSQLVRDGRKESRDGR